MYSTLSVALNFNCDVQVKPADHKNMHGNGGEGRPRWQGKEEGGGASAPGTLVCQELGLSEWQVCHSRSDAQATSSPPDPSCIGWCQTCVCWREKDAVFQPSLLLYGIRVHRKPPDTSLAKRHQSACSQLPRREENEDKTPTWMCLFFARQPSSRARSQNCTKWGQFRAWCQIFLSENYAHLAHAHRMWCTFFWCSNER